MQTVITQPAIVLPLKEWAVLITIFTGAFTGSAAVVVILYSIAKKSFSAAFNAHAKPLAERLGDQIEGVSTAVNSVQRSHELMSREVNDKLELHAGDIERHGVKLDEHDEELEEHHTRIAVLESARVAFVNIPPVQTRD